MVLCGLGFLVHLSDPLSPLNLISFITFFIELNTHLVGLLLFFQV